MLEQILKIADLGGTVVVAGMGFYFVYLTKSIKNGNGGLGGKLDKISDNHLDHIESAIDRQTENSNDWHQKQFQVLCEIKGELKSLRK